MKAMGTSLGIKDITLIGMMVAVIEVCKVALAWAPNIELTSFLLIMFTLFFGKKIAFVVPVFILIEGAMYGVQMWWIMYLYAWPLLALFTWIFRKQKSVWFWSILSGVFGLMFGFLCSFPYVVIGAVNGGIRNGLYAGFAYWIAGIPFDITHCIGNFVIMLVLYEPIRIAMRKCESILL
jgi:energy-coupling factor transport system substrate-specific component